VMFSMAMWMALIVAPLQIAAGDMHGLNTLEHQPAKVAAMEGHYETRKGAPLVLFGIPDDENARLDHAIEIPHLGSLILTHEWNGEVKGLKHWAAENRPPAEIVFWSFRVMVGIGFLRLGIGLWSAWARWKGRLHADRWLHRAAVAMGPSGFVAVVSGWITTEVGRQPWVIHGLLRTADAASPLAAPAVGASLLAFIAVYFAVFGAGTLYILRLMAKAPGGDLPRDRGPLRTAGITPAPGIDPDRTIPAQ